jgi:hypothetical protein
MMADDIKFDPDDLDAVEAWLRGDTRKGSPRDLQARRTLEQMLRGLPYDGLLDVLAAAVKDGRLVMRRKRGRRQKDAYSIAAFVYQRTKAGVRVESAVKEAEDKFGVKSSTVYSAWSRWRPFIEQMMKLADG